LAGKKQVFYCYTYSYVQEAKRLSEAIIEIGHVTHFFPKIGVATIELILPLSIGDRILIKVQLTEFEQIVDSMQIDRKDLQRAEGGQNVGLKIKQPARQGDVVYKKL